MAVKMNLRIITKRFAADPEIGFLTKSISKANGYGTAMPPAWELIGSVNSTGKFPGRKSRCPVMKIDIRDFSIFFIPNPNTGDILIFRIFLFNS